MFSVILAPKELYSELLRSYSATGIIDLSPGQGELVKASLLSRTKCLALAGADKHAAALELAATDFLLQELAEREARLTELRQPRRMITTRKKEATTAPNRSDKKRTKHVEAKEEGEVPKNRKKENEGQEC